MTTVFEEINPFFRPLFQHNILLIGDCLYKCVGNVPFSYIVPHQFDSEVDDNNHLLGIIVALLGWSF
jgi:hypothetical protein